MTGATALEDDGTVRNRLLTAVSSGEFAQLRPHLERVHFEQQQVLFEAEEKIGYVYFPETMVVSLVTHLNGPGPIEVGTAGFEGMAGLPLFLGDDTSPARAFAQIPGVALRMEGGAFLNHATRSSAFHQLLLRYTQAYLTQVSQTAACNGAHLVDERCARWLLLTHDRVGDDEFPLTHEFLAMMLGVRRAGVTVSMRALQDAGVIRYARGRICVVDRARLEEASCECYAAVKAHVDRLLPPPA